ncbi:metal-dependent hydrolase [Rothia sp. P13129]|uniref:metal-dependent hydrolase n=1 Tax=Rothia sp. P13129 TaxID=3402664 RepID=UPI003AC06196
MMGYTHSLSAAATWLALVHHGVVPITDHPTIFVTTLACAGAGMLPDIDHRNGTIARSIPPLSGWICAVVQRLSGGHRQGTHSFIGVGIFWALALSSPHYLWWGIPWLSIILVAYAGGLALRTFGAPGGWLGAVAVASFTYYSSQPIEFFPLVIGVGSSVHILGDALTRRGVNLLWPLTIKAPISSIFWKKSGNMALPILGASGSRREQFLAVALMLYIVWVFISLSGFFEW